MPRSTITTRFAFEETNATVLQRVNRGVSQFSAFVFSPAGAIAGAAALGAGLTALTGRYLENADALQKMSLRTGVGTSELGALQFAFEQADLSADDLQRTISRLNDRGLTLDDFADQIAGIDDIGERTSRTIDVLGERLGPRLLSVLDQGSEGLDRYRQQHERLGLAIDQESAEAAARFNDNVHTINAVIEGAGNQIGQSIINWGGPILEGFGRAVGILPDQTRDEMKQINETILSFVADGRAAGKTYGEAVADGVDQGLFTELDAIKAKFAADVELLNSAAKAVADNPQEALSLLTGNFGTPADEETNRQAANAPGATYTRRGAASPFSDSNIIPDIHGGSPALSEGALARVLGAQFARSGSFREHLSADQSILTTSLSSIDGSLDGIVSAAQRLAAIEGLKSEADVSTFELQNRAEAFAASRAGDDVETGDYGGGGFGGGSIDGQSLIDASKADPVRVTLAGIGGLNEGAGNNQNLREIRVDGDELFNTDALREFILTVVQDYLL